MTAPKQPLVERVAMALCPWVYGKKRPQAAVFIWTMLMDDQRVAYREQAHAALDACHAEELREALRPFAECAFRWTGKERLNPETTFLWSPNDGQGAISIQHILNARAILAELDAQPTEGA